MVHRVVRRYMYSSKFVSLQLAKRNVRFQDGRRQALTTELGAKQPRSAYRSATVKTTVTRY
jgi:hypothetical protein